MRYGYFALALTALLLLSSTDIISAPTFDGEPADPGTRSTDFTAYHDYEATAAYLQALADDHPEIVELEDLGDTRQGRDILAVKVSDNVELNEPGEPDILFMGAHHGNEPISVEVPLYILDFLVTNYDTNGTVARWVDSREIWFVPMVNPDGIEAGTRKNQNIIDLDGDGELDSGTGVDLNRNYDQNWGTQGTSTDPTDNTYCGEYAFSEFESRAIWELVDAHDFVLSMSFHSFGEKVYYPWGNTIDTVSPQGQLLEDISAEIAERNGYLAIEGNEDGTYVTSGDSDDWLYSRGTLPFTIELSTQFKPPEAVIESICRQNLDSSLYILEIADQPSLASLPDWTFMVYMAGDNSLNLAAIEDINEMEMTGSTQDVNIIALYDGTSVGDSKLYKITKDVAGQNSAIVSQVLDEQGQIIDPDTNEADMSSTLILKNFIDWTMEKYPAQKTALIIWDHGDGLMGGLAKDGNYWMPTWGMRTALVGHHIDIIGTDLCWQGNFETAYEVMEYSDYYVGSVAEEPQDGWDYAAIMEYLGQHPNSAPGELSRELVRSYKSSTVMIPYATLSAIDLYVMKKNLMPIFEEFSLCMYDFMYHNQTAIKGARTVASVFDIDRSDFVDLHEFAENLLAGDIPSPLRERTSNLLDALNIAIIERHSGIQYPNVKGMALYLPEGQYYDTRYDAELLFASTPWNEFVNCFRAPVQTPFIEHTGSDVYENFSAVRVNATITDDDLDSGEVYLKYRLDGGTWTEVVMDGSGSQFYHDIQNVNGAGIEYYISATDMAGNTMSLPYGITRGNTDYFSYISENSMNIQLNSITHSPSTNVTEGDNVTFTILAENQGTAAGQDINVSLFIGTGDNATLIDYTLVDILPGQMQNVSLIWEAVVGNHTIQASVSSGPLVLDTMSLDILVGNSTTDNTALQNEVERELNELWLGVIVMVLGASAISFTALLVGRRTVKGRKKALAYRAVDNASYYVNSFADFGADISLASWKLEKAREAIGEDRYDAAYKLALEAKESVNTFDIDGVANNGGGQYHR